MSLERTTSLGSLLLSSTLLALAGCGDDSTGTGTSESATGGSTDATTAPMTTMDSVDTTAAPETTTTGDPTTGVDTTAGEESSSEGSSTTGVPGDCAGSGMSFSMLTSVDNDLVTNLDVDGGFVSCNRDITLTATGGTVCIVDDGAGGYYYVVETIEVEDVPPMTCGAANVGLSNISIVNDGDGTEVVVPQAGGAMVGNQSIAVLGDVQGNIVVVDIDVPLADFTGVLPEGDAAFAADDTTLSYADVVTVVATATPDVMGTAVAVTLTGLTGSLTYAM